MTFGVMFHHFYDHNHPRGQGAIDTQTLRNFIQQLKKHYNLLSAHDYYTNFLKNTLSKNDICLTFDDGLLCQWDVALPVLNELGVTAFWFIYSSVFEGHAENIEIYRFFRNTYFADIDDFYAIFFKQCERYLKDPSDPPVDYLHEFSFYTANDIKFRFFRDRVLKKARYEKVMNDILLQFGANKTHIASKLWLHDPHLKWLHEQGHIIGAHSYSHPTQLIDLPNPMQFNEYRQNIHHIERVTGAKPVCLAHPCNSYNQNTLVILQQLGFKLGFRSNRAQNTYRSLEYPREDHSTLLKK